MAVPPAAVILSVFRRRGPSRRPAPTRGSPRAPRPRALRRGPRPRRPRHPAGGIFMGALAPGFALEAVRARPAEIPLHVQEFSKPPVVREHSLYFLHRGLKAPVVADRERHLVFGAGARRRFRVP